MLIENFFKYELFVLNFIINDVNPLICLYFLFPEFNLICQMILKRLRAASGIEPETSRTRNENHTTRPSSQIVISINFLSDQ